MLQKYEYDGIGISLNLEVSEALHYPKGISKQVGMSDIYHGHNSQWLKLLSELVSEREVLEALDAHGSCRDARLMRGKLQFFFRSI